MRQVTLVYCLRDDQVLLGMKKKGFGAGKLNGYGGKPNPGEDLLSCAVRELSEEAGIIAVPGDLEKVAEIDFHFPEVPDEEEWDQTVHVYFLRRWAGTPGETSEMRPEWHPAGRLPFEKMWVDDPYWLPCVLDGKKLRAGVRFKGRGEEVAEYSDEPVTSTSKIW